MEQKLGKAVGGKQSNQVCLLFIDSEGASEMLTVQVKDQEEPTSEVEYLEEIREGKNFYLRGPGKDSQD